MLCSLNAGKRVRKDLVDENHSIKLPSTFMLLVGFIQTSFLAASLTSERMMDGAVGESSETRGIFC